MRKSQAAKYARWSAGAALLCAAVTFGVYLKREYTRIKETKDAPPAPAVNVERQSTKLTFSKGEGTRIVFTVEASKSTDFKGANASDLEGVKVTVFGKEGDRHDTLETHTCRYSKDSGDFDCAGIVEITLMSKAEWEEAGGRPSGAAMKVETRGMAFNRASGEAKTENEVQFTFANGRGQAVGATYNSDDGTLELLHSVHLKLDQPQLVGVKKKGGPANGELAAASSKEPVDVTGSRLDFNRDAGTMYLSGPAQASTHSEKLTAAAFHLKLDDNFRAKRLTAKRNDQEKLPEFTSANGTGRQRLTAEEIAADFAPQGWVRHAEAHGQVTGEALKSGSPQDYVEGLQGQTRKPGHKETETAENGKEDERQTATADNAEMEMVPGQNEPKLLVMKGRVDARTSVSGPRSDAATTRKLTTEELRLAFAGKKDAKGTRLENAHTPGAGRIEWNDRGSSSSKAAQTILQASQLNMNFDANGAASRLDAKGNVETERTIGGDRQTATANTGFVELQPTGGWSRMQLNENVQLNEPQKTAHADQAVFVRAEQTATLTGHAMAKDATSQTTAQKLIFWQNTGEVRGEGNVHSSDLSAKSSAVHLAPVVSNATAEHLQGNSKTGRAVYTGHARLWQGDSVLEAESVELLKNERILNAVGKVRAVFPQMASANDANAPQGASTPAKGPVLWHAQSAKLTYWDAENRAHLWQDVVVQAPDQKMRGPDLELFFTRAATAGGGASTAANGAPSMGAQQISRAVGTGGVTVVQGDRRATAERGVYTAADGKFVMSGGTPTLFDANEGTTTGRQLTFFLADATIIVDSENGSRTLTKHRVEK